METARDRTTGIDGHTERRGVPFRRKSLKRLVLDAIRLWRRREEYSAETHASRRSRITHRLDALITDDWANKNATRLVKRLRKYRDHLFTFLDLPYVPFENNFAECEIRPAVIMRKNSDCNRSDKGADTQAILITVFRTLKQRNLNPIDTVVQALRQYNLTAKVPTDVIVVPCGFDAANALRRVFSTANMDGFHSHMKSRYAS